MTQRPNRKLVLLRHAKSAWPDVPDHERPLADRGIRAAPVMGRWLRDAGLVPDQVLCSTARRARETWQFAQAGLAATPPVSFEDRIYDTTATGLLALIREVPPATGTLLLIGHNPAIEDLALMLAAAPSAAQPSAAQPSAAGPGSGTASSGDLERMRAKFPTAAIAVLQPAGTWRALAQGRARLTAFVTPRTVRRDIV
jgi:phosphohistidine phosphatase